MDGHWRPEESSMDTGSPAETASLSVEPRDGYLRIHVRGNSGCAAIQADYWKRVVEAGDRHGSRRLLVVEDLPTSGFGATIEAVATCVAGGLGRFRVAFVDLREGAQSFAEFGGEMARSRGIDARVFRSEAAAERWLLLADGPTAG